ncbi:MAG: toxin [Leptospiraceae bacterium]|nr:toxin [Leptospiraceae bacterium]
MKLFRWDSEKSRKIKSERGLSFEDVIYYIEQGRIVDIIHHPNQTKYKGQKMFILNMDSYIYLVPFVESDSEIFLKTIIPSRKATKHYLKDILDES